MSGVFEDIFSSGQNEKLETIRDFYNKQNINFKTDLDSADLECITKIDFINNICKKEFKSDLKLTFLTGLFKELKVSHKRKGRSEWVEVMKTIILDELQYKSAMRRALGI